MLTDQGYSVVNLDGTIIAQRPKLSPYIPAMRRNIAQVLDIAETRINLKATTEEGLGFTGSGEGIAAQAVALLQRSTGWDDNAFAD
jgi:2-C-methyl-D-erythritol 2,4-cyclodiphosphate synthase